MDREELLRLGDLNYVEALRLQTRAGGGMIVEGDGLVLMLGGDPHPVLNVAVRTDPSRDARVCVEAISEFYSPRGHGCTITLLSGINEDDLGRAAEVAGFVSLVSPSAMVCRQRLADRALPDGCELRAVGDGAELADFCDVSKQAWATYAIPAEAIERAFSNEAMVAEPYTVALVGYVDGRPASAALLVLSHGIAGVYWVGTVPSVRGHGLAEACTRAVTNRGFDMGARAVILQASPMGHAIYLRMGYADVGSYRLLAKMPQAVNWREG